MSRFVRRDIGEPARVGLTWEEQWFGPDKGLIQCWERGREKRVESPDLARRAAAGELPVLCWRGGVETKLKADLKYGTLGYLATWQGLRGEDLAVDLDAEPMMVCTRTGQKVVFTAHLPFEVEEFD